MIPGQEALELEALRMALDILKTSENTAAYRDLATKAAGRLGPGYEADAAWVDAVDHRAVQKQEKLEAELNGHRVRRSG